MTSIVLCLALLGAPEDAAPDRPAEPGRSAKLDPSELEFFESKIRPLLVEKCYRCHSADAKRVRGGLLLDTQEGLLQGGDSGPALVPGKIEKSLILQAVRHENDLEMPPREKLSDAEIEALTEWVRLGAPDPRSAGPVEATPSRLDLDAGRGFWAYVAPKPAALPSVEDSNWPRDDVDRFLLARMEKAGLRPVADAERRTLIRRLSFDLTGLPPTPAEVRAFLADERDDALEQLVDRLLASPAFAERWGRHWLDVARYAESTGKTRNFPYSFAWRYRDWVIDSIHADKPWDRFLVEQIAGDLLPADSEEDRAAQSVGTGFLALGPKDFNERNMEKYLFDCVDEQLDTTFRAVLATTVTCARCHDHKFDPIPTTDYYALAGIFRSSEELTGLRRGGGNRAQSGALIALDPKAAKEASADKPSDRAASAPPGAQRRARRQAQKRLKALEEDLASARQQLAELQKLQKKNSRGKKNKKRAKKPARARLSESGGTASDEPAAPTPRDIAQARARVKRLNQELNRFRKEIQKRAKKARGGPAPLPPKGDWAVGLRDGQRVADCAVRIRGEVRRRGEVVPRGTLSVLPGGGRLEIPEGQSGRLELARWIASPENPLTARVLVNRVWQHLFGEGLVRTVDNFGASGERPTHPLLLDRLALDFIESGWSLKKLVRRLVLTRAYGLSSIASPEGEASDPANTLLWRAPRKRLEAEALRDTLLAASGELVTERPAGSPVSRLPLAEIGRARRGRRDAGPGIGEPLCRSVYLPVVRGRLHEMLETFDFADPSLVKGHRDVTTVATQALYLLNSPFVRERSENLAARLEKQSDDPSARIRRAYEIVLSRPPSEAETERVREFLASYVEGDEPTASSKGLTDFVQALFASAEFRTLD